VVIAIGRKRLAKLKLAIQAVQKFLFFVMRNVNKVNIDF
jgi:hypothetical protein